jgi:shikimate kinase
MMQNIYLIGPMGSGKTSLGQQLAKIVKCSFYDSDDEIEKRTGVSVSWIFEKEGEAGFRKREQEVIAHLTKIERIVLATGGGCVVNESNCQQLHAGGTVIYLTVSLEEQFERTSRRHGQRPLLMTGDPKEKLRTLNDVRDPLYKSTAHYVVTTDNKTPMRIAKEIWKKVC